MSHKKIRKAEVISGDPNVHGYLCYKFFTKGSLKNVTGLSDERQQFPEICLRE